MALRRTLICEACGKEWDRAGQACKAAGGKRHSFVERAIVCKKPTGCSTNVCRLCIREWCGKVCGEDSPCEFSADGKHEDCEVELDEIGLNKHLV